MSKELELLWIYRRNSSPCYEANEASCYCSSHGTLVGNTEHG